MRQTKLKNARLASGFTQKQMAEKLGLKTAGYRQKETGERKISISEANIIAKTLETTLDAIFLE